METNKNHSIKLIYDLDQRSFKPDKEPEVKPGESISFVLVTIPAPNSEYSDINFGFRVVMDKPDLFEPSEANNSDTEMVLTKKLTTRTTYTCELIDPRTDKTLAVGSGKSGGGVRPGD